MIRVRVAVARSTRSAVWGNDPSSCYRAAEKTPAYRQAGICGVAPAHPQVLRRTDQGAGQILFLEFLFKE
jgi:hypothetical protein